MPIMRISFTVAEIVKILADHVRTHHGMAVNESLIEFDIEPECQSNDPREHRDRPALVGVTVSALGPEKA